ncbi:hypothetical protein PSTT_05009 [Puccinia striiformis]|uniref:HPP transmembrane region domain-containing protein n=2 Tax=Puccinia striiformis TaxID=27350 RepID=A0A2S4VQX6_9BASI|nr:hypothetical protein PSTT_05009 [Puccinia striiformis]
MVLNGPSRFWDFFIIQFLTLFYALYNQPSKMPDQTKHSEDFSSGCESVDEDAFSPYIANWSLRPRSTSPSGTDFPRIKSSPVLSAYESLDHVEIQVSSPSPSYRDVCVVEKLANFDLRPKLPSWISRFLGYRKDGICRPVLMLRWLDTFNVPLVVEEYFLAGFCTTSGLICVIAINTLTPFATLPISISPEFVGALAIIFSISPHSPAGSPRDAIISNLFASMLATIIGKFCLADLHDSILIARQMNNQTVWVWACVSVTTVMVFQKALGLRHPVAGGTALLGTIHPDFMRIGWGYVGVVMSSVLCMIGVALFWGNLGRRSYPNFWFISPSPSSNAVPDPASTNHKDHDSLYSYCSFPRLSQGRCQSTRNSEENLHIELGFDQDLNTQNNQSSLMRAS